GKAILVDNEGKPMRKVDEDSEDEVASDGNEMASFLAKRDGYAAMLKINEEGYYTCNIHVEHERKPPRCACCKVFGHAHEECPKNTGTGEMMNMKKTSQIPKRYPVGQKMGFKPKQVYQPISKKTTTNTSTNKKNNVDLLKRLQTLLR
nr:hypothetical protein [Tanacetum cinerariifolium]